MILEKPTRGIIFVSVILVGIISIIASNGRYDIKAINLPTVQDNPEIEIPINDDIEPISFHKAIVTIKRGTRIGTLNPPYHTENTENISIDEGPSNVVKSGEGPKFLKKIWGQYQCDPYGNSEILWGYGTLTLSGMDGELSDYFRDALTPYGYDVTGNRDVIFERDRELTRGTYRIAARVKDLKTNICQLRDYYHNQQLTHKFVGEMWIDIDWTVYSILEKRTIAKINTAGSSEISIPSNDAKNILLLTAFGAAADNLAKAPEFQKIFLKETSYEKAQLAAEFDELVLSKVPHSNSPFSINTDKKLDSVVTIRSTSGHGSGFIISSNGYFLTNSHVVGKSNKVRVKFNSGFELPGVVKRFDKVRDVALIKVDISGLIPFPLNRQLPEIASHVYAVGTPLMEKLETTVTEGIVSAIRTDEISKLPVIQSDVAIQLGNSGGPLFDSNGNVIGIAFAGYNIESGINLFIPIESALDRLNIKIE